MKKILVILFLLLAASAGVGALAWVNKKAVLVYYLRKELNVPVKIETLEIEKGKTSLGQVWLGNPKGSTTQTAFSARTIELDGSWKEMWGTPLTIDEILLENIFVGIEQYAKGKMDNNWAHILRQDHKEKKSSRDYLIRKLVVRNLTVVWTKPDGSVKQFPTIDEMVFYNISSETGFPLKEIEKAIFQLMMKEILRRFDLNQLLDTIIPSSSPLRSIPFFK